MLPKNIFIRNIQAEDYFEVFFISAISSILIIRFFLFLTKYPQLGRSNFHIAHMLWGGFFMLIAIVMLLSLLNKTSIWLASFLGGIGFGIFIDELGKFITSDNNYFYKPTVALIYVIFIILYLFFRAIPKFKAYTNKEYFVNALDLTKEAILNDLDVEEAQQAREYLKHCDKNNPITKTLHELLDEVETIKTKHPSFFVRSWRKCFKYISKLIKSKITVNLVVAALILQSGMAIFFTLFIALSGFTLSFDKWGVLISSIISAIFVFLGLLYFAKSKRAAFKQFKTSVLISIFLTQFFVFYSAQFYALISFFLNILVLSVIDYVLLFEQRKSKVI